jgi:hypothetical protein
MTYNSELWTGEIVKLPDSSCEKETASEKAPSSNWISQLGFDRKTICVIQCDLEKHSAWFAACLDHGRQDLATKAKEVFAKRLDDTVAQLGLVRIFWAGDGGAFASPEMSGRKVIEGARRMLAEFRAWQKTGTAPFLERLGFRVSCHICMVYVGPDPAFWASEDLNVFFKNEREISHANTVSITSKIFEDSGDLADDFRDYRYDARVKGARTDTWLIYLDGISAASVQEQTRGAVQRFVDALGRRARSGLNCQSEKFSLGDSIVLHLSPSPTESIHVELSKAPQESFSKVLEEFPQWKEEVTAVLKEISPEDESRKKADLTKASPLELRLPLSDFPLAKIRYSEIKYSNARSFLTLVKEPSDLWKKLAAAPVDYPLNAPVRPGILVVHIVILVRDDKLGHCVLLGQRAHRVADRIGFQQGDWSASIEEQFRSEDVRVQQTVLRGLQEELLADQADSASSSTVALFLERRILNLAVAAICRTNLNFETIMERLWPNCVDHTEHSQFVALPIRKDVLVDCMSKQQFTQQARDSCKVHDKAVWEATTQWNFHPSTPFRLALALWAADRL